MPLSWHLCVAKLRRTLRTGLRSKPNVRSFCAVCGAVSARYERRRQPHTRLHLLSSESSGDDFDGILRRDTTARSGRSCSLQRRPNGPGIISKSPKVPSSDLQSLASAAALIAKKLTSFTDARRCSGVVVNCRQNQR
jgi:hypothetical protein